MKCYVHLTSNEGILVLSFEAIITKTFGGVLIIKGTVNIRTHFKFPFYLAYGL